MSKRKIDREAADPTTADLEALSLTVGRVLPPLLQSGDHVALARWTQVRGWIDNALDGEVSPDLATIDLAVAYLADLAGKLGQDTHK